MDVPQGHLWRNTGIYTKAYDKHVNQRRLRDNLFISVRREDPRQTALIRTENTPYI